MSWHYLVYVVATTAGWAVEVEDPTNERELVRRFSSATVATEHAAALCRQLSESGDDAEMVVSVPEALN